MVRRALALLTLLALVGLPATAAGADCRPDRLGNTVCRDLRPEPPPLRAGRTPARPQVGPPAALTIPAWRTDAFGVTRPARRSLPTRSFAEPPRPGPAPRACLRDRLGNLRCP